MKGYIEFFLKVGLIIMAIATMITMNACSKVNNGIANDVCMALSEKYGESFVATKIGDRFNTDSAKLYVHPVNNESVVFTARIHKDSGVVEDNYIEEKVNYQVEQIIKESFLNSGIEVSSSCMVVSRDPLVVDVDEYTPKSFQEKYLFDHYTIYLVVEDGSFSAEDIISSVKKANAFTDVKLLILGYIFDSENYSKCVSALSEIPDMGITMIETNSPVAAFNIIVSSGECSISETELAQKIGRS